MTKPFSVVVLHKHVEVDFIGYVARKQGETVDIKPKEIQLLKMLAVF